MKKIRFLLGFLSKKGCFWAGLLIGLLGVLFFSLVSAHAYYTNSYSPTGATCLLYSCTDNNGYSYEVWADFLTVDGTPNDGDIRIAYCSSRNRPIVSNYEYKSFNIGVWENSGETYSYYVSDYQGLANVSNVPTDAIIAIPLFSDFEKLQDYIAGKIDITECDNYEDLKKDYVYDSSIAAPSKLYINSLSASSVTVVWEYSDNSYEGLQYEVQVENYYAAQSFAYAVLGGYTGSSVDQTIKLNGYINSLNQLTCKHTVEGYLKNPSGGLDEEILVSGTIDKSSGDMHSIDTYISVPVDYSDQFVYSGNPFFQGVTNAKHPVYLGSQVTVIPYRVIDGVRYKGNTVVCRRFVNSALNTLVGSTFTEIGSDSNGNSYINRTENVDITGESTSGSIGIGDTGTFFSFLNQLMSMLMDQTALLGVFNNLLSSVPAYIWVLIGFSIVVGIVAMIVKFA